jgi:hypothetical protein
MQYLASRGGYVLVLLIADKPLAGEGQSLWYIRLERRCSLRGLLHRLIIKCNLLCTCCKSQYHHHQV